MGSVIDLTKRPGPLKIQKIPPLQTPKDALMFLRRCIRIFRVRGDYTVVVLTKRGELMTGYEHPEQIVELYESGKQLESVHLVEQEHMLLLAKP